MLQKDGYRVELVDNGQGLLMLDVVSHCGGCCTLDSNNSLTHKPGYGGVVGGPLLVLLVKGQGISPPGSKDCAAWIAWVFVRVIRGQCRVDISALILLRFCCRGGSDRF